MRHDPEEFSFLAAQAERLGAVVPAARRVDAAAPDGAVSAIAYGSGSPRAALLHGAGLNAHTWDATAIALGAPAVAIDLPGHGDSAWRDDADYTPATIAPAVARAIEAAADDPVVLVGHSLGGLTAAAVAAARPELVSHLVLVDITPEIDRGGPSQLRAFYERLEFGSREELVAYALSFGLGGDPENARRGVHLNSRVRQDGVVEWKHHFARIAAQALGDDAPADPEDGWRSLEATTAPITLVRGTRGFVDDDAAARFAARLPSSRTISLDAPHNVQEVAPRDLAAIIRKAIG
nr:alpha/beta hydrolase [Microbacterium halophytorum]